METIKKLATKFRKAIEKTDKTLLPEQFEPFPKGCCWDVAALLAHYLDANDQGPFKLITGERKSLSDVNWQTHAWLEKDGFIIDISADQFGSNESFMILTMVALGGTGSIVGPLVGALILVLLPEMFRFLAEYRMVLYGLILMSVIVLKPGGLLGVKGLFERSEPLFKKKKKQPAEAST